MKGVVLLRGKRWVRFYWGNNEGCDFTEGKMKGAILLRRNEGCDFIEGKMKGAILLRRK